MSVPAPRNIVEYECRFARAGPLKLERLPVTQEAAGSGPVAPAILTGVGQIGEESVLLGLPVSADKIVEVRACLDTAGLGRRTCRDRRMRN